MYVDDVAALENTEDARIGELHIKTYVQSDITDRKLAERVDKLIVELLYFNGLMLVRRDVAQTMNLNCYMIFEDCELSDEGYVTFSSARLLQKTEACSSPYRGSEVELYVKTLKAQTKEIRYCDEVDAYGCSIIEHAFADSLCRLFKHVEVTHIKYLIFEDVKLIPVVYCRIDSLAKDFKYELSFISDHA